MLEPVADQLWLAEGEIVSFYGFAYPTRMVVVKLAGDALWVWSPIRLTDALRAETAQLGRVAHLVSPNKIHHLWLADWSAAFPDAKLWGPRSTIAKRRDLVFDAPLADAPPPDWADEIDQAWFHGSFFMDEVVFFHRASKTAILADLIEAFSDKFLREHWGCCRPLAYLDGLTESNPGAPREWRLSFIDRRPARAARARMLSWDCERVIMAHGEWRRSGGRDYLKRAFAWLGPAAEAAN